MTGGSLGIRVSSYGILQQHPQNNRLQNQSLFISRKPSKMSLGGSREKERILPVICRYMGRSQVGMFVLFVFALLAFISGYSSVNRDAAQSTTSNTVQHNHFLFPYVNVASEESISSFFSSKDDRQENISFSLLNNQSGKGANVGHISSFFSPLRGSDHGREAAIHVVRSPPTSHPCNKFSFPPPPPADRRRIGPRPCPVCYLPVDQAIASMPSFPSQPTVLRKLEFIHEENPIRSEPHAGSEFGGYPSLKQRNDSFDIAESMIVHCGFVRGSKPGRQTGFDIDEANLIELEQPHDVIVASAIFGNYDLIQQPKNISEIARQKVPFYMFIDEETEAYMRNSSSLDSSMRVGLWRVIVVHNVPYLDARRNGKVPKLLLHRLFPNVRYSIWIDGKLELVVDPYQILERFLWRHNATFAISRHYRRFDVFEEAEANKAAGKYDNSSIDSQIEFYKAEGLTPYSRAKLPITSDVPEGCVIIKEHIPITNLFTCLWFNEVDRFTARDQLSFSTVRDKIMSKGNWTANMFLDCERRNFVIQTYHKDILEHIPPPVPVTRRPRPPSRPANDRKAVSNQAKKNPAKRARGERRSRRHRKVAIGAGSSETTILSNFSF